ncbi:transmembrane protein, putative [Flavobacteriales bacterium ALC-1]|nr:transmembrane protein, putative [Flavobacteriales bacterium ALC-1]
MSMLCNTLQVYSKTNLNSNANFDDPTSLIITGIIAGGNTVDAIELYVVNDIPDLSFYAISIANQGGGSDGPEYYLNGSALAGDFIYLTHNSSNFQNFFGFNADFDLNNPIADLLVSGDDAVELFVDIAGTPTLIDTYGDVIADGTGTDWDYTSSWVYRKNGTGPDGGFQISNWRILDPFLISYNALGVNADSPIPFPIGTYGEPYDDIPPTALCISFDYTLETGSFSVTPDFIDNGSSDNEGIVIRKVNDTGFNCNDEGVNQITLTVYDAAGNKDTCTSNINVTLGESQILCEDKTVSLSFNGEITIDKYDVIAGFEGPCFGKSATLYLTETEPVSNYQFQGETTSSSPTDDAFNDGNDLYYESFSFTVSSDGNYLPEFSFNTTTPNALLFAIISDQPIMPNVDDVTSRPGFLNGFVYEQPSVYLGDVLGDDEVFLIAGTTYYLEIVVLDNDDNSNLLTATINGNIDSSSIGSGLDSITYTADDIGDNIVYAVGIDDNGRMSYCESTITVTSLDPFVTTWKTDNPGESDDNTIRIPGIDGGYDFDVDWGDGNISYGFQGTSATHAYSVPGTYTVSITGDFPRIYFNDQGDKNKILTIEQWGNNQWTSMVNAFEGCENLNITNPNAGAPNLSEVTSVSAMFSDCEEFNGDVTNWDVSNVEIFDEAFAYCDIFNQPIGGWNMSNATSLDYMFYEAYTFNQPLNNWNVSNVINMEGVFSDAVVFNQDLNNWNVSNVISMDELFYAAEAFNGNISSWNVSNVENMEEMFDAAYAFNQDISNWNVSNVTNMEDMFDGADVFNQDISNWNVGNVTDMSNMFSGADAFNQDISGWDVSSVTTIANMFSGADAFDQNLGSWDIGNIVDTGSSSSGLRNMFGSGPSGVDMSVLNYDATLIGWNIDSSGIDGDGIDDIPQNIDFGGGKNEYCTSEMERQNLIDTHGWTISDNGESSDCGILGVSEIEEAVINIFPNPTKDIINIEGDLSQLQSIDIYNLRGQLVKHIENQFEKINLKGLSTSVYIMYVKTVFNTKAIRIIKE